MKISQQTRLRITHLATAMFVTFVFLACVPQTLAQWATNGTNINNTNTGNVGVGTSAPAAKLHVSTSSATVASDNTARFEALNIGPNVSHIHHGINGDWYIRSARGTGKVILQDSGGNVGIGVTAPGAKLDVLGTIRSGNADTNIGNHPTYGSTYAAFWRQGADYSLLTDGTNTLLNAPLGSGNIYFRSANADRMVLVGGSGNLGIGVTAPTERLHVAGNGKITGNLTVDGNIAAKYQDVAEWVPSTQSLAAGTVVVLDTAHTNHVVASSSAYDTGVAGVVSETPGLILGEGGEGKLKVATTGRVKVRVDATQAAIKIGDLLVTGDVPGVAMKSEPLTVGGRKLHAPGTIIGKALEPLEKGVGEILVLLSMQ